MAKNFEYYYEFWRRVFWSAEGLAYAFASALQAWWDKLPKAMKVAVYMAVAGALDEIAQTLSPQSFSFIPAAYRFAVFNFVEVLLVEGVKYLKAQRVKADEDVSTR